MTKDLLRWDDSPGLEHHCPKCQTPLHNPRAKNTCYLKHVEVCPQFHQHFFLIGQSHNCDTCRRNDEAHEQRHRQLALQMRQLAQLQLDHGYEPKSPCSPFTSRGKRTSTSSLSEDPELSPKLKKRERKKAKKRIKALKGGDALTTAEIERVALALHPPSRSNSTSSTSSSDTNTSDPTNSSEDDTSTTENSNLDTLISAHKSFAAHVDGKLNASRMALQNELLSALSDTTNPLSASVDDAANALGLPVIDAKTPKAIAETTLAIKEAVRQDLFCVECDKKKFYLRQAAWYRFASRSVLALGNEG